MSTALLTVLPLVVSPAVAQTGAEPPDRFGYPGWHHGWGGEWGWYHMIFGGLMMILFWGGLILLIVLAVRWLGGLPHESRRPPERSSARAILEERFARGEIDKEEFEERRRLLSG